MTGGDPERTTDALDCFSSLGSKLDESDSLTASMSAASDHYAFQSQMEVEVSTYGHDRELQSSSRDEICGVGYEAIRNACAHSGGTELSIEIFYGRRLFQLDIRDNGRGVDHALLHDGKHRHLGLMDMRDRALRLGGTLRITSARNVGTTVSLQVPGNAAYLHRRWGAFPWIVRRVSHVERLFRL
jgi:signal transduction histidine kinase